ncbi:hypothetical protein EAE99_005339 [Botrytis elliptica]|nr:hypothetical protein EAE99_005339 [Botrytis elliptica]
MSFLLFTEASVSLKQGLNTVYAVLSKLSMKFTLETEVSGYLGRYLASGSTTPADLQPSRRPVVFVAGGSVGARCGGMPGCERMNVKCDIFESERGIWSEMFT